MSAALRTFVVTTAVFVTLFGVPVASAQSPASVEEAPLVTLDEATQIALINNYLVKDARLLAADSREIVREGWGLLKPQVSAMSDYTRNVRSADPFAGSAAGGLFRSLGFIDWLAFNEQSRTDSDPGTDPISFNEFVERQQAGLSDAGIVLSADDNLFSIPNQVIAGVSVSQKLFDARALIGASGASKYLKELSDAGLQRQEQLLVDEVRRTFYSALLARESALVVASSAGRTAKTADESAKRVAQGVAPKFERLSAEVRLANLETQLIEADNGARNALDQLKLVMGISIEQPLRIAGDLENVDTASLQPISTDGVIDLAVRRRPDVEQARLNLRIEGVILRATRAERFPTLDGFANFNYIGNVPDDRNVILSNPDDPFSFSSRSNGFFSDSYWDVAASVGLNLRWTIYDGAQRKARIRRQHIARQRAELAFDQLTRSVRLEVMAAQRDLEAAQKRIASQTKNVDNARLNYQYASARLREGVASPLEEREASSLLDESRLAYLQAVHDMLVARSAFETAVGIIEPGNAGPMTDSRTDTTTLSTSLAADK